jgi:hypothetical protein
MVYPQGVQYHQFLADITQSHGSLARPEKCLGQWLKSHHCKLLIVFCALTTACNQGLVTPMHTVKIPDGYNGTLTRLLPG